ncbi:MAG: SIS domain-containing protein [Bacilli bacterium]|nr:SIS domain-containing protein [Bacilli bacterium]
MDFKNSIKDYYKREKEAIDLMNVDEINEAMNLMLGAYEKGATVFTMGNGGSSATASHMVCDFMKGTCYDAEKKFRMVCLNDNMATIMAMGNDIGFDQVFAYQMKALAKPGDIVVAISGSGNSKNVINACEVAKEKGVKIIGMTGFGGGKLHTMSDAHIHLPVDDMQLAEDAHMIAIHMMMQIFMNYFGSTCGHC